MPKYIVESKSRAELRLLAEVFRMLLNLTDELRVPIVELLDVLSIHLKGFSYEIVPDEALPEGIHAETDIRTGHITIKESVYEGACNGLGRDRMTIAHEIGHFITLCFCGFKLQRGFKGSKLKTFNDPEWQAKCFAGEFMISRRLTANMTPIEISRACGVSYSAAYYQYKHRN